MSKQNKRHDEKLKIPERPRTEMLENLRLSPEKRLCAKFDDVSIAMFKTASRKDMGMRVLDNCAEENIK